MQHHLKTLGKCFCLFALSCTLLLISLPGLQQHTLTAHAAPVHTASTTMSGAASPRDAAQICLPPCVTSPTFDVYVHTGTEIWGHNGVSSALIDNNQIGMTNGGTMLSGQFGVLMAVIARGAGYVYEVRQGGFLFQIIFGGCSNTSTGYCLHELDDNQSTSSVAAGGSGLLYQTHTDGSVWQLTALCFHCWTLIDNSNAGHVAQIVAAAHLYELRINETVWRYNGCGNQTCWTEVDSNPTITRLAVGTNGVLYELRSVFGSGNVGNGILVSTSVLEGFGPFNFQTLDTVGLTDDIVASTRLYQGRTDSTVLLYQGGSPAWQNIGTALSSPGYLEPGTSSDAVYQARSDSSIWEFTPEMGTWIEISAPFPDTVTLSEPTGEIFFLL